MQCGGWTIDWQGDHNSNADFPGATSIYAGIEAAVTAAGGIAVLSQDGQFQQEARRRHRGVRRTALCGIRGRSRDLGILARATSTNLRLLRRLQQTGRADRGGFLVGPPAVGESGDQCLGRLRRGVAAGQRRRGDRRCAVSRSPTVPSTFDFTGRLALLLAADRHAGDASTRRETCPARCLREAGASTTAARRGVRRMLSEDAAIPSPIGGSPEGSLFHAATSLRPGRCSSPMTGAEVHLTTMRQAKPARCRRRHIGGRRRRGRLGGEPERHVHDFRARERSADRRPVQGVALDAALSSRPALPTQRVKFGAALHRASVRHAEAGAMLRRDSVFQDSATPRQLANP